MHEVGTYFDKFILFTPNIKKIKLDIADFWSLT